MEKLAVAAVGAVGAAYAADWWLGFSHDRKLANAGLKALEYMLRREAEGKASTVEPFITTARGPLRDKEFLVFEDYSATFGQIDEESNRLAQLLRASGVEPGQYVSILWVVMRV